MRVSLGGSTRIFIYLFRISRDLRAPTTQKCQKIRQFSS